jgi:excisionase family DNA binding protein
MKKEKKQTPAPQNLHLEFDNHLFENEVWLTTEEAMAHLNVSRSTIYRLRKQQHIPNFKLGHIPMYPKHLLNKVFLHRALSNLK